MKRSLIYGGVFSFAACSFLFSSCSADKDELGSMMGDKSPVLFTAVIDDVADALRASWEINGLNTLNPDYSKPEKFNWEEGDALVALSKSDAKSSLQENIKVTVEGAEGKVSTKLLTNGTAWFFYPSAKVSGLDTTNNDVSNAYVQLNIPTTQDADNQSKAVYLKTNSILVEDGKVGSTVKFNHLTSLLRFHIWNQTGNENLAVESIELAADAEIFPIMATYNFTLQETNIQEDLNKTSWTSKLVWKENNPKPLKYEAGSGKDGDVYDALLVTLPVSATTLSSTKLTVTVKFKDGNQSFTPTPVSFDGKDLTNGFPNGKRTYFNIKIDESSKLKIYFGKDNIDPILPAGSWGIVEEMIN